MTISTRALGVALALGSFAAATPALAQYGSMGPPPAPAPPRPATEAPAEKAPPTVANATRKFDISNGARKAIIELQNAVNAQDVANIPAKLAAAQAVAKTNDDKYVIAQMQLKAAVDQKNSAGISAALQAMLASGGATPGEALPLYVNLGKQYYNAKQYDGAASQFERVLALDPNNTDAMVMLAETRKAQGRVPEAVALLQKGIAGRVAAGQKPSEEWYKRAVALAYGDKLPAAVSLSRDWVAAYPTPSNWRDTLRIYQSSSGLGDDVLIDVLRLQRAAHALAGESDYYRYANTVFTKGFPGEAKAVLDEGFAAKAIDRNKPIFHDVYAAASAKVAADRASLPGLEKAALASPAAKQAMLTGDVYLGYADYAKAAAMYRAALTKTGVDTSLANLHLGMVLAMSGDKAGASAAFKAVSGTRADIAKYWLLWSSVGG
jgi:tetratricopeptide (TPR) repeat protein